MNNSFTSSLYDSCNIEKKNQESIGPYNWITDSVHESSNKCFVQQSPFMQNQFQSIPYNLVDIESDLRNQTMLLSRCPDVKYNPAKREKSEGLPCDCEHCKKLKKSINECTSTFLTPNYTRVQKPCNIFSGININRFHPLCDELQDANYIQSNDYIGTNTRLLIRDSFRKEPSLNIKLD
jgi:hypothetical protein